MQKIVFHKLLGFGILTSDEVDFSDATFCAKLGAKIGDGIEPVSPKGIDFQDENLAKLGAKVGFDGVEPDAPPSRD